MPTTIEVNKQSVEALLGSGKSKPFVIPEYQRPYAWTDEQVETLFEDLWDFTATSGGTERESSYFLGSVVSYENEDGEQEIIDGQQRITSLFLLLRAIYTKLIATPASERTAEANNFIGKIEPTIWRTNKLTGTVDFKNTIIIMTSNAGAQAIIEPKKLGFAVSDDEKQNYDRMKNSVMEEVRRIFKPEFLNRIDETIVFRALNKDDMKQIVALMLKELTDRCEKQMGIHLTVRDSVKKHIVDKAYDPKYGARPLRRQIQNDIEDELAEEILSGKVKKDMEVVVTIHKEKVVFETK